MPAKAKAATQKAPVKKEEPKVNNSQTLPPKEGILFKTILRCYETKAYKKGLKAADKILETFPLHGETLAMKGLTMNCLNKKEEATALVKKGLAMNVKSHVCWHVYGLLYRSEQKYDDAIKCYQNALRIDQENLQILKDLALLQIQRRMHDGFQETRRKLLVLKTTNQINWIAYAIGNHLNQNYAKAISVLNSYFKTQKQKRVTYENSELLLYKNMVIEESGNSEAALTNLNEIESEVLDKIHLRETRAKLNLKVGNFAKAEEDYVKLMNVNNENYEYHLGLMRAKKIFTSETFPTSYTAEQAETLDKLYKDLASQYKRCAAIDRIPLNFLSGAAFQTRVDTYLRAWLRRGIPSLFRDLSSLYADPAKVKVISELIDGYLTNLRVNNKFAAQSEAESPSAIVWTLYFAGHHHDHLGNVTAALAATDEAIAHTPTNVDLFVLKARIFKHVEAHKLAHEFMNQARLMDTADRYLNTKCTRFCWRKDSIKEAEDTVSLFLRDGDNLGSLKDMQCSWYEIAAGRSYTRQKNWGRALKMFTNVIQHFHTIEEDQSDFHSYCLRKMTLRAYVKMMRMEDRIRSHRFFFKAAEDAIKVYLTLWDNVNKGKKEEDPNADASEQKRLDKKAKRDANKAKVAAAEEQAAAAKAKAASGEAEKKQEVKGKKIDEDPDGLKLLTETPLEDATKILNDLLLYSNDRLNTHLLSMEVYLRKQKYLLVLRSLKKALSISPGHPAVHTLLITFLKAIDTAKDLNSVVAHVIATERPSILTAPTLSALNDAFLANNKDSLPHRLAVSKCNALLGGSSHSAGDVVAQTTITASTRLEDIFATIEFLQSTSHPGLTDFKSRCHAKFPISPAFITDDKKEAFEKQYGMVEPLSECTITPPEKSN